MYIRDCMKRGVISARAEITIRMAVQILIQNHIGTLPLVDSGNRLVGVVGMPGLLALAMPDFVHLVEDLDFVGDFGAVENMRPDAAVLDQPVHQIMGAVVAVAETAGLLRAASLLQEHNLYDLPVVDEVGHLVGIASSVDIGVALMSNWAPTG